MLFGQSFHFCFFACLISFFILSHVLNHAFPPKQPSSFRTSSLFFCTRKNNWTVDGMLSLHFFFIYETVLVAALFQHLALICRKSICIEQGECPFSGQFVFQPCDLFYFRSMQLCLRLPLLTTVSFKPICYLFKHLNEKNPAGKFASSCVLGKKSPMPRENFFGSVEFYSWIEVTQLMIFFFNPIENYGLFFSPTITGRT